MHASNKPMAMPAADLSVSLGEHAAAVEGLWSGSLGRTVRCVPTRRTLMVQSGERVLYGKLYRGRARAPVVEWRWLHLLPMLSIPVAQPVALLGDRRRRLIVMADLPGRSLDALAVDAAREGWLDELIDRVLPVVADLVGRLFAARLVHRDLNCAHLFVDDPRGRPAVALLDLERVFRPPVRWRRWVVKDLAALWASLPVRLSMRHGLRFLQACLPASTPAQRRRLVRSIAAKADRVARHRPRFG